MLRVLALLTAAALLTVAAATAPVAAQQRTTARTDLQGTVVTLFPGRPGFPPAFTMRVEGRGVVRVVANQDTVITLDAEGGTHQIAVTGMLVGDRVRVIGTVLADGGLLAVSVKVASRTTASAGAIQPAAQVVVASGLVLRGLVTTRTATGFVVHDAARGMVLVTVSAQTRVVGKRRAPQEIRVSDVVVVEGELLTGGNLAARQIDVVAAAGAQVDGSASGGGSSASGATQASGGLDTTLGGVLGSILPR
jgi:hypothetical protein